MHPETPREAQPAPAKAADGWKPTKEVKLRCDDVEKAGAYAASVLAGPELAASRVIMAAEGNSPYAESMLDGPGMLEHLAEQARAVSAGDMTHAEAMLHTQAVGLQSLFVRLVERAMRSEYTSNFDVNMRHALAAQRQSARALETLAMLRQGPTVFARQANVVNGPQQVNVGTAASGTGAGATTSRRNEVLEDRGDGQRLDPRETRKAGRSDSGVEAVAALDRTEDARRQGAGRTKRTQARRA